MRPLRLIARAALVALCLGSLPLGAGAQSQGAYLFDVLKKPKYRGAWNAMMKGWAGAPAWLTAFSRSGDGVATPGTTAVVSGVTFELYDVCKPHDCADNKFEVMFEPGGGRARGLLTTPNAKTYFGDPSEAEKAAQAKAAGV